MNKENKPCPICHGTDLSLLGISCKYCNGIGLDPVKRPDENKPRQCDNNELKPCPFCNKIDLFYHRVLHRIFCKNCKAMCPRRDTPEEAWEMWNKRSDEDE